MKTNILYSIFLMESLFCYAQQSNDIFYGTYIRHPELGAYDESYDFSYDSNTFTYSTDDYNSLTGRVFIKGKYRINGDTITFYSITVLFPVLSNLSRLTQDDLGMERVTYDSVTKMRPRPTNSNFWSLTGKDFRITFKKLVLDPEKKFSAAFYRQKNDEYIEIDGERFYVDPGPEDF